MAFDAGAVVARMELDEGAFNASIDRVEARLDRLAGKEYHIKVVADYDPASTERIRRAFSDLDQRITRDMISRQRTGSSGSMFGMLNSMFSRGAQRQAAQQAGAAGGGLLSNVAGGAGPGVLGIGARPALIGAAIPAVGALLPSVLGVGGTAIGGGLGLGVAGLLGSQVAAPAMQLAQARTQAQAAMRSAVTPAQQVAAQRQMQAVSQQAAAMGPAMQSIFGSISHIQSWWEKLTKSMAPTLAGPLHQVAGMITQLAAPIRQMFAGAMTIVVPFVRQLVAGLKEILPLLGQMFRASAPGFALLTRGLLELVRNILPGLNTLIKATAPYMGMFARTLATLGADLGKMFAIMAPAVKPSMVILDALLKLVGSLMPVIGRLAVIFAGTLAPVIVAVGKAFEAVEPAVVIIFRALGGLAKAVLTDVGSALIALAKTIVALTPSLTILGKVFAQLAQVMESSGIWGTLGTVLEAILVPVAKLVNALVRGLAPALPGIIKLFGALATDAVMIVVKAFAVLIPPLIRIVQALLPPLVKLIQQLLPVITVLASLFAAGLATALVLIIDAVAPLLVLLARFIGWLVTLLAQSHLLIPILIAIAIYIDPIGVAIAALIIVLGYLATHWRQIWGEVKRLAEDAWNFLTHGWGQYIILPLYGIRKAVEFVKDHWKQAWNDIKQAGVDAWHFIHDDVLSPLINFITKNVPNAFKTGVQIVKQAWTDIGNVTKVPVNWVIGNVINGLIRAFDWVSKRVGGPQIPIVPQLARGGRLGGYGGGDILPALLEPGETVISKEDSRHPLAKALFSALGVPGYQAGGTAPPGTTARFGPQPFTGVSGDPLGGIGHFFGSVFNKVKDVGKAVLAVSTGNFTALSNALADMIPGGTHGAIVDMAKLLTSLPAKLLTEAVDKLLQYGGGQGVAGMRNPLRAIRGLVPERIDMGVDYAGTGPIYAIGPGVIGSTLNSGWPGGAFISERLTGTPYAGKYIYFAENIAPRVHIGQRVGVNDIIGQMTGGIEAGWASGFSGNAMAAVTGEAAGGSDPGANLSAYGANFNQLMMALGVPSGTGGGHPVGHVGKGFYSAASAGGGRAGSYSVAGMAQLWRNVGGAANLAHLMGAIGMAESRGDPRVVNSIGASGLWQILMPQNAGYVRGNVLNPMVNAAAAHRIYLAQGLGAWETYTNGAYRQFMDSGGWLMPGATVALNQTGMREAVLQPRESQAFTMLAHAAHQMVSGGGRGGGGRGQIAEVMNIMLPEGTTLAQMMAELVFRVKAAELAGTAGAIR